LNDALATRGKVLAAYYDGDHALPLKITQGKDGKPIDDNVIQNFTGLVVNRSVSRMLSGGLEWELPEGSDAQKEYLDTVWELNKKPITLFQVALNGSNQGTAYIKILPDEMISPYTGIRYPSLVAIDPTIVRIKTDSQDMTEVEEYRIEYVSVEERDGRKSEVIHLEVMRHASESDYEMAEGEEETETPDTWWIDEFEKVGSAPMELVRSYEFPYNFPPLIHCKNLPSLKSCYGRSDIEDVIGIQNKSNFVVSNTTKIVKFFANPTPVITGMSASAVAEIDTAVGRMIVLSAPDAKAAMLETSSDLASSNNLAQSLRQSLFDISREIDLTSMADKIGALTNFGLRVLWADAIDKNDTKRQLYGDMILELNRRLLVMAGYEGEASRSGVLRWGDALPVNIMEEMQADKIAQDAGWVDRETIAKRYEARYGVDYETIVANIAAQKEADNATNSNVGAMILRNFSQGQ
jgi:hypothetical protein